MKTLLYTEDNDINRLIVEELACDAYIVHAVETAKEAFELAKKENYDILLIDLNLNDPEIDGFGVMKKLKTYPNLTNSIFIAHTNYFGDDWKEKCLNAGFDFFYPKPFEVDNFSKMIASKEH